MDLGINGKLALVVGASRGMGNAVADELEQAGCRLIRVSRTTGVLADISQPSDVQRLVWMLEHEFGFPDIVVHVAGGSAGIRDHTLPSSDWAKVWQLNLGAAIDINRAVLPKMVERGWGRVVHFSSNGVKIGSGRAPYISAKHAVEGYVQIMSRNYSPDGVVITAVSPGPIYTKGIFIYEQDDAWTKDFMEKYLPMGRWGQSEEVAAAVALLCSQRASYMAGTVLAVDGGMR